MAEEISHIYKTKYGTRFFVISYLGHDIFLVEFAAYGGTGWIHIEDVDSSNGDVERLKILTEKDKNERKRPINSKTNDA